MFKRLILVIVLAAFVMAPVQAIMIDDLSDIATNGWVDDRDTEGQARPGWLSQGSGAMKIDYGVTNDTAGVPNPLSGWDYTGAWIGVGGTGAAFDSTLGNTFTEFNVDGYLGDMDRVPSATFAPGAIPALAASTNYWTLDVFKSVANNGEHVRELQLYDSLGNRNTYTVQAEATATSVGAGWTTYTMPMNTPNENNADLSDIVTIKLWVSAWSAWVFQNFESPGWPDDYAIGPRTGTPVEMKNLILVPEPATMTMLSLGGLALLRRRKK